VLDIGEIGLTIFVQRRWDTDHNRVHVDQCVKAVGRLKTAGGTRLRDSALANMADEAVASSKTGDLLAIDIKPGNVKAGAMKREGEWEADIAKTDHSDVGGVLRQ
jgi:hypothetical protein